MTVRRAHRRGYTDEEPRTEIRKSELIAKRVVMTIPSIFFYLLSKTQINLNLNKKKLQIERVSSVYSDKTEKKGTEEREDISL